MDLFDLQEPIKTDGLQLIVLGQSGSRKSGLIGTYPGRVLYLYGSGEAHGAKSASISNKDIVSICWDKEKGEQLSPDAAYTRLKDILTPEVVLKHDIKCIAIDSATELEKLVRSTKVFENKCATGKNGAHNNFAEPGATVEMIDTLLVALRDLQEDHGIDFVVTCILDVQEMGDDGEIMTSKPRLSGYSVAENIIQQFGDIVVIGKMTNPKGQTSHRLQFNAGVKRESKDIVGNIKKCIGFDPRLTGVEKLPASIKADIKEILKLKGRVDV